ncbi:conserved hypothetical protein [Gluconacetobacter diazotrophicus PA1 5]|uniref:Uncharacterized protein n=1 Tax=Gluconacetobacter diazotrophicus (strain ATCC 49037 / DSM 5601 / CCUG 37298 / CIP 103539 / LMG 7603 / PAl5) TaxID=272568 RepID=A9HP66_GLUDA|nr:conserved hypothetical protein [Gluconacetobacter diazotrophicus PA1 5]
MTQAYNLAANSTTSVSVQATTTGTVGNLAANTALTLVSPIVGVVTVAVDGNGLAGGAPIEPVESWRARIIANIRAPVGGGTVADYQRWAKAAGAAYVNVIRAWLGLGTVGVAVAMAGGVAPTPAQVTAIQAYIDSVRPVRGNVTVFAATIVPQNLTILLNPDTVTAQAAVASVLGPYYLSVGIGGTAYLEQINAQISAVAGEENDLVSPTADQAFGANQMPVLGTIAWQAPS